MYRVVFFGIIALVICINYQRYPSALSDVYRIKSFASLNVSTFIPYKNSMRHVKLKFSIEQKFLKFNLKMDDSFFSVAAKVYVHSEQETVKLYLRNMPSASIFVRTSSYQPIIYGYFVNGVFIGSFQDGGEVYYLEPNYYHKQFSGMQKEVIAYSLKSVVIYNTDTDGKRICQEELEVNQLRTNKESDILYDYSSNILANDEKSRLSCSLELLADYTFFNYMNNDLNRTISEMLYHVMNAQIIFQNVDADGDGKPDGIGFNVEMITILESENIRHPIQNIKTNDYKEFLEHLSKYHHPYCMSIYFCHRDFWNESGCAITGITDGICSESSNSSKRNGVIFVSNLERNSVVPRFRVSSDLVHQFGHAFGCSDDPVICRPGDFNDLNGNYIMHPDVPYGSYPNNFKFSACCLKSLRHTLKAKDHCLKKLEKSTCGNGVIEEGETCDCNESVSNCKCCNPKGSPYECTLRRNAQCFPGLSKCCDDSCKIGSKTNMTCFSNKTCFNASSTCRGDSPFCPTSPEPDGSPCFGTSRTCRDGKCISNICEDNGLELCECKSIRWECHICCKSPNTSCLSGQRFNFFTPDRQLYLKQEGSLCGNNFGKCLRRVN
ncbi:disintegrin and metalloproteinase domain-containing protein 10-like [Centruroides vittatus]|uniref:disintegrin and metalloproteinase domain-containing protein 10-like n=1 Tax=Centruroides vittatus TaxID=120091 RepID=UPI00350FB790